MRHEAALLVLIAATAAAGCQSAGAGSTPLTAPAQTSSRAAPSLDELRNLSYPGISGGSVTLKDGVFEGPPAPGSAARPRVQLAGDFRLTGDLDGDGVDEAVVVLSRSAGGSGTTDWLAVARRTAGGAASVASAALGDRIQIRSARIEGRTIRLSVVRPGPQDARCCPGELADLGWTLSGTTLSATPDSKATGRLSPDVLAGAEWVLRGWTLDEPAPPQPEVTLSYVEGRLAGRSACNRYSAAVKPAAQPGDLALGPAIATRMACQEPAASVETRFLKQLGAARKFGFLLGDLVITYEPEGGALAAMRFERRKGRTG